MFIKTIRKFFAKDIKPLGRWHRIYDERVLARIDLANYDHCGPCGNENVIPLTKINDISKNNNTSSSKDHFPVGKPNAVKFDINLGGFK